MLDRRRQTKGLGKEESTEVNRNMPTNLPLLDQVYKFRDITALPSRRREASRLPEMRMALPSSSGNSSGWRIRYAKAYKYTAVCKPSHEHMGMHRMRQTPEERDPYLAHEMAPER